MRGRHEALSEYLAAIVGEKKAITTHGGIAWLNCDLRLKEPEIVRKFVCDRGMGVAYLNDEVAKRFNASQTRHVLKFAGVFSHQRPYVNRLAHNVSTKGDPSASGRCELADLMFLAVVVDKGKMVLSARATFFQAKKSDRMDNETQKWLYDFDDRFQYVASEYKIPSFGLERTLPTWDEERSSALQYLILNPTSKSPRVRLTPWVVEHGHPFGFFLYRMLTLSAGKLYDQADVENGGWSTIVRDVLGMAARSISSRVNRGSEELDTIVDYFNDFRDNSIYYREYQGGPGGVSLILAIIQDTQLVAD